MERTVRGRPGRLVSGAIDAGDGARKEMRGSLQRRLGRNAERFGMGPAVVLGQDLGEVAGLVGDGPVADLAAGDRQLGDGYREAAGRIVRFSAWPAGLDEVV